MYFSQVIYLQVKTDINSQVKKINYHEKHRKP